MTSPDRDRGGSPGTGEDEYGHFERGRGKARKTRSGGRSSHENGKSADSVKNDLRGGIPGKAEVARIGGDWTYVSECPFIGLIDEVMIFDRALTKGEVRQIYDTQR